MDGCLLPITFPVTVVLGEDMASALKCPGFCTGDRRRAAPLQLRPVDSPEPLPYSTVRCLVEPLSIHMTLFSCLRRWSTSSLGDHACKRGCRVRASIYVRPLSLWALVGVPLIDTLDKNGPLDSIASSVQYPSIMDASGRARVDT